ncbi:threonine dehydratase [Pseudomonas sp. R151218B TE3479]
MHTLTRDDIEHAARRLYQFMPATAQYAWPLLAERLGCTVWVKHENHTPTGAFKVRGGLTFVHWLKREQPEAKGIVTATRGNHGQSLALAATALGLKALIVVPQGNSVEKNNAMRGFGGEVVEYGRDFDEAREEAARLAHAQGLYLVPPFHPELVRGVATYGLELFKAVPDLGHGLRADRLWVGGLRSHRRPRCLGSENPSGGRRVHRGRRGEVVI